MANKDYYSTLGISRTASADEIKSAYKKLAKQWHPDVNKAANATEKFKEINEAYSVLSDQQKRQTYDQFGSDAVNQGGAGFSGFGGAGGAGFDFSDFFRDAGFGSFGNMEDLFRGAFGGEFYEGGRPQRQAAHVRVDVELEFEEAAFGVAKTVHVQHLDECEICKGTGSTTGKREKCATCKGRGMETHVRRTAFGMFQTTTMCSRCGGSGEMVSDPCKTCHGKGSVKKTSTIEVEIPAGVDTGNHLRLSKQGNFVDGKRGDVYVVLHVKPHAVFKRDGPDIYLEQAISYYDAVLGGEVEIPILGNKTASLKIPAGTKPGTVFRMKDKGIKFLNEDAHGDQYVHVEIEIPQKLSSEEKTVLEELRNQKGEKKDAGEKPKRKKKGLFGL